MVAVIFEFTPASGRFPGYMELLGQLKSELGKAEGFISLERLESINALGKFVSLQSWRDGSHYSARGTPLDGDKILSPWGFEPRLA